MVVIEKDYWKGKSVSLAGYKASSISMDIAILWR